MRYLTTRGPLCTRGIRTRVIGPTSLWAGGSELELCQWKNSHFAETIKPAVQALWEAGQFLCFGHMSYNQQKCNFSLSGLKVGRFGPIHQLNGSRGGSPKETQDLQVREVLPSQQILRCPSTPRKWSHWLVSLTT